MKKFLIAVPVYNEEKTVCSVAEKIRNIAGGFADILFINDGSTDQTGILLESSSNTSGIRTINRQKNLGYGQSIITGIDEGLKGGYEFLITLDCDEQHRPKDLIRFRDYSENCVFVSGTRYHPESGSSGIEPPADRLAINKKITQKLNRSYGWNLTDAFCGFKRFRLENFREHSFMETGYAFPMETWAYLYSKNYSFCELPVPRIYITDDRSFGEDLDRKRKRYRYYLEVWKKSHYRYLGFPLNQKAIA